VRQIAFATIFLATLFGLGPDTVSGQSIRINVEGAPLEDVLSALRTTSSIDVVYAGSLVEGVESSCMYEGDDPAEALLCVLEGSMLRAERVRRRQFVLMPMQNGAGRVEDEAAPRESLAGFVRDRATGEILPGAHVVLSDLRVGTLTNDAGYFAFPSLPPGEYRLRVSFIGFAAVETVAHTGPETPDYELEPQLFQSEAVLVEGDRDRVPGFLPPPGLVSVPVRELQRLPSFPGEQDLLQVLQWFTGVQKVGEIDGGLSIRGGAPDENLYLIDGAPIYHPWHALSLISTFQTEMFSDVKLYRGAFPAEHGGRISAVLDAQLKDGNRSTPRATAALGAVSGRFIIESPLTRNSSFMISGRRSYLDMLIGDRHPVEDESGRRDTLRTGYFFHDFAAKASIWSGSRHRLSASYFRGGDRLDLRLPFDLSLDFSSWLRPATLFFEIDQYWTNEMIGLRYQYLHGSRFFSTLTAYRSRYRAREGSFIRPSERINLTSDYNVLLSDLGLRWDAEWYLSLHHELRVGLHVVGHDFRSDLDGRVVRSPSAVEVVNEHSRQRALEASLYVQNTWQPSQQLRIQPGLRAGYFHGGRYFHLTPRLGVQYAFIPDRLMIRAGGGIYTQYLHRLRDRHSYLYDLVSSRWIPTDENVRPSRSYHATAGAEAKPVRGLRVSADAYWYESQNVLLPLDESQEKDGIAGPGIDVPAVLSQFVPGEGRSYGVEFVSEYEVGGWNFLLSYAGSRAFSRTETEDGFRPGRFDVPRSMRGLIRHDWSRMSATLSINSRSGYPHTVPVARYELGDPLDPPQDYLYRPIINNGRLPAYYHIDLNFQYRFDWAGARWTTSLQMFNITNNRNVIGRQFLPTETGVEIRDRRGFPIFPLFEIEMRI